MEEFDTTAEEARLAYKATCRLEDNINKDPSCLDSLESDFWWIISLVRVNIGSAPVKNEEDRESAKYTLRALIDKAEEAYIQKNLEQAIKDIRAEGD